MRSGRYRVRILVVEDETKVAHALREGLEREKYEVVLAPTGEEGFFLVNAQEFDLVILDSLDSASEGVGEKDSSKPSMAIKALLDVCLRHADGRRLPRPLFQLAARSALPRQAPLLPMDPPAAREAHGQGKAGDPTSCKRRPPSQLQ